MKCTVWGIGAIGAAVAARLEAAGDEPTLIARTATAELIGREGLHLRCGEESLTVCPRCVTDPADAGVADVLLLAVKAHTAPELMAQCAAVLGPDTVVVPLINGVPWWYFSRGDASGLPEGPLPSIDPDGVQWRTVGPQRVLGAVVYDAAHLEARNRVVQSPRRRIVLGEPDGSVSARVESVAHLLRRAGYDAPVTTDIRREVWMKLLGNLGSGPLAVLTRGDIGTTLGNPALRPMARALLVEAMGVAERLGVKLEVDVDARLHQSTAAARHKPSLLQDLEAGRRMELEPMVGVVAELARRTGVATPTLDTLLALTRALDANLA